MLYRVKVYSAGFELSQKSIFSEQELKDYKAELKEDLIEKRIKINFGVNQVSSVVEICGDVFDLVGNFLIEKSFSIKA